MPEGLIVVFLLGCLIWWLIRQNSEEIPESTQAKDIFKPLARYEISIKVKQQRRPTPLELSMKEFSLNVEANPTHENNIEFIDYSTGEIYQVYLHEQTCTCEEFKLREGDAKNNLRRWCTHIMQSMYADAALAQANDWIKAIGRDGYHGPLVAWLVDRPTTGPFLLTIGKKTDWINIYARTKKSTERVTDASGEIDRFGWNIQKKEWAYGVPPPGSRELKKIISVITSITITQMKF